MNRPARLAAACLAAVSIWTTAAVDAAARTDCIEGSGVARREARHLAPFTMIEVNGVFDVHLAIGTPQQVSLSGDDNLLAQIRTEVHNGILTVDSRRSICVKTDLRLDVRVPAIESVAAGGSVSLRAENITGRRFALTLDGSSHARIQGDCRHFEAVLLGATGLEAEGLKAEHVTIQLTGAGEAAVYAAKRLDAKISGVGTVTYAGSPAEIHPEITGVGELIPR